MPKIKQHLPNSQVSITGLPLALRLSKTQCHCLPLYLLSIFISQHCQEGHSALKRMPSMSQARIRSLIQSSSGASFPVCEAQCWTRGVQGEQTSSVQQGLKQSHRYIIINRNASLRRTNNKVLIQIRQSETPFLKTSSESGEVRNGQQGYPKEHPCVCSLVGNGDGAM